MLLDMLATLERRPEAAHYSEAILDYLPQGKTLRQRHLTWLQEVDRRIAKLLRLQGEPLFLDSIQRRLNLVLPNGPIDQERIRAVAHHPVSMALMSVLLPRKDIPTGLEKLYYLTYFNEDMQIEPDEKQAIIDTWTLLANAAS
jgi:hypothetical protein